ncbi:MAG: alpha/beta hydrolase [Myxococcota bacterium]
MHRTEELVAANGIRLRVFTEGRGPAVLLCHGFPGLWYSWRHQISTLAAAGYRALAVDMRGYGGSDRPLAASDYDNHTITADLTGVLDALGESTAVLVGHDFGAQAAWSSALKAPERFPAVVSLAVPYGVGFSKRTDRASERDEPRVDDSHHQPGPKPSGAFAAIARKHFIHLHYFQEVGVAEAELGAHPKRFLERIYWALSGSGSLLDFQKFPSEGTGYLDVLAEPSKPLPWPWFTEHDLDYLVGEYLRGDERTAFIGGLNSYRAMDINWANDPDYGRKTIECPALLICGAEDPALKIIGKRGLETMPERVSDLRGIEIIPNAGHFVQQEQPEATNRALLGFLAEL